MADSGVRQRKAKADEPVSSDEKDVTKTTTKPLPKADEESYSPWLDILRVLTLVLALSSVASYTISGGESFFWGMRNKPTYLRIDYWKSIINGPVHLTLEELASYDGSDPAKPLYLAINGTIYDVSVARHIYGPDGSYRYFSGCDAARAYVTGCFADDRTPDMRGVEEMFLPIDDAETDAHWTAEELDAMRIAEFEAAQKKANKALKHWVDFFADSAKYTKVGYVVKDEDWLEKTPKRGLCAAAAKGRKKRKIPK